MKGVIIGDIVGSAYERHNTKNKEFKLFKNRCRFTDDTVMTVAVADALLTWKALGLLNQADRLHVLVEKMQMYGRKYLEIGYSKTFKQWLQCENL